MSEKDTMREPDEKLIEAVNKAVKDIGLPLVPDDKTLDPLYVSSRTLPLRFIVPVSRIRSFFDSLRQGRLTATACAQCGRLYFPPQADCPDCKTSEMVQRDLGGTATLIAYTVINVKPFSFMRHEDYIVAIGRLPEGLNVLAWLKDKPERVRIGMKIRLVVEKREPEGTYTYCFEPA